MDDGNIPGAIDVFSRAAAGDVASQAWLAGLARTRLRALGNRRFGAEGHRLTANGQFAMNRLLTRLSTSMNEPAASARSLMAAAAEIIRQGMAEVAGLVDDSWVSGLNPDASDQSNDPSSQTVHARWHTFDQAVCGLPELHRLVFQVVWFLGAKPGPVAWLIEQSPKDARRIWRQAREMVLAGIARGPEAPRTTDRANPPAGAA